MTVNNGGRLEGTGTVGATTIASGGVIAPGIGTLVVAGNLGFAPGSIYEAEFNPASESDLIRINGAATAAR